MFIILCSSMITVCRHMYVGRLMNMKTDYQVAVKERTIVFLLSRFDYGRQLYYYRLQYLVAERPDRDSGRISDSSIKHGLQNNAPHTTLSTMSKELQICLQCKVRIYEGMVPFSLKSLLLAPTEKVIVPSGFAHP